MSTGVAGGCLFYNTKNRRTDVEIRAAVFFTYPATLPMLKRMCRTAAVREAFDRLDKYVFNAE